MMAVPQAHAATAGTTVEWENSAGNTFTGPAADIWSEVGGTFTVSAAVTDADSICLPTTTVEKAVATLEYAITPASGDAIKGTLKAVATAPATGSYLAADGSWLLDLGSLIEAGGSYTINVTCQADSTSLSGSLIPITIVPNVVVGLVEVTADPVDNIAPGQLVKVTASGFKPSVAMVATAFGANWPIVDENGIPASPKFDANGSVTFYVQTPILPDDTYGPFIVGDGTRSAEFSLTLAAAAGNIVWTPSTTAGSVHWAQINQPLTVQSAMSGTEWACNPGDAALQYSYQMIGDTTITTKVVAAGGTAGPAILSKDGSWSVDLTGVASGAGTYTLNVTCFATLTGTTPGGDDKPVVTNAQFAFTQVAVDKTAVKPGDTVSVTVSGFGLKSGLTAVLADAASKVTAVTPSPAPVTDDKVGTVKFDITIPADLVEGTYVLKVTGADGRYATTFLTVGPATPVPTWPPAPETGKATLDPASGSIVVGTGSITASGIGCQLPDYAPEGTTLSVVITPKVGDPVVITEFTDGGSWTATLADKDTAVGDYSATIQCVASDKSVLVDYGSVDFSVKAEVTPPVAIDPDASTFDSPKAIIGDTTDGFARAADGEDSYEGTATIVDMDGNPVTGLGLDDFVITSDPAGVVLSAVTEGDDGVYTLSFTSTKPGVFSVTVAVANGDDDPVQITGQASLNFIGFTTALPTKVTQGDAMTFTTAGWMVNDKVSAVLHSPTTVDLKLTLNDDGTITGKVTIPTDFIGEHCVIFTGEASGSVQQCFTVDKLEVNTGGSVMTSPAGALGAAALLLALGISIGVVEYRRRAA
jgi:hypothetical protein